ncbi:MAG: methionyl-tRNA formyltransferase [Rhodospirillales bacterium]|nr:methionyl-tRNA formyltransferase [Rhodospirillales bacterium]
MTSAGGAAASGVDPHPASVLPHHAAQPLRLAFMGSAAFSLPSLTVLLAAGHEVVAVYTQPPRPAGRGHKPRPGPVHAFADARGLAVRTPASLRDENAQRSFSELGLDAAVVAAYGLILPQAILDAPRFGCLNVHGSLLPRWRGAAPIERAILAGDTETGVTIMQMEAGLDTGPVLLRASVPIGDETTAAALHASLGVLGAQLMVHALDGVAAGTLHPTPQPAEGATYATKLGREEGRIDWTRPADVLDRCVRALNPQPGVWFEHGGERIKVLAADRLGDVSASPGLIVDDRLAVACGAGALRPLRLQRPGRTATDVEAFLRGFSLPAGTCLA